MLGYIAKTLTSLTLLLNYGRSTEAVLADTWDYCNCRWDNWGAWSECDSDCFGRRVRTRSVWLTQYPGCDEFTDCASNDEGSNWQDCNNVCYNGGTPSGFFWSPCFCQAGFTSTCCTEIVNCGTPSTISDASLSVTSTNYGGTATYTCNTHYNMTAGNDVRICQNDATWSGTLPSCLFANYCGSTPCQNGATCINLLGDFRCDCLSGWSGQLCEKDIQPPVLTGCESDVYVNATEITVSYKWTTPSFTDPMGSDIDIVSNYPNPEFTFPWGDYAVQYVATKKTNGLSTECTFKIKVRPTPCPELNIPVNGAILCNNWQTDYGQFCMITCQENYTIGPSESYQTWYVCGASGTWIASGPVPDCDVPIYSYEDAEPYQPEYGSYVFTLSCNNATIRDYLQERYISILQSTDGFSSFCYAYPSECLKENVDVRCY